MADDYTAAELKLWITKLHDPDTPQEELKRIAMTLAHLDNPEALLALEEFRKSLRAEEVEWIDCAVDESTMWVLDPKNESEQKDYVRVELWQEYEEELYEKMAQRDAAEAHMEHLKVEKEFFEAIIPQAPNEDVRRQIEGRLSDIEGHMIMAACDHRELEGEVAGLEFMVEQIEKAVESPIYRKYGKREIGVHLHRDCEDWLKKRKARKSDY